MNLAVIDTAVFVAGVFWRHEPHRCLKAWLRGRMTPVMTEEILAEYEAALEQARQEQHFTTDTALWMNTLRTSALWVTPVPFQDEVCRDPKDNKFVEAALGEQECYTIIARDRGLTVSEKPFGIDLYTPREWLIQQQSARINPPARRPGSSPSLPATEDSPTGVNGILSESK